MGGTFLQEPSDTVKRFLETSDLELDVVLDTDGKLCEAFMVDSIPHTVIIDRTGIIKQVSHGFRTDLAEHLCKATSQRQTWFLISFNRRP